MDVRSLRPAVVGRETELAEIRRSLHEDAPALVVVEGDAGIGKTTVFDAVLETESSRFRRLVVRASERETSLPHVALRDLLEPLLDESAPRLPGMQRRALESVLLRADSPPEGVSDLAVAAATLEVLRAASDRPLLVAVDDLQWLDLPSANALGYALRRLPDTGVAVLATKRTPGAPSALDETLTRLGADRVPIGPLAAADLGAILRDVLALELPRRRLEELRRASGGNPLYALEIARETRRKRLTTGFSVPEPLLDLLRRRIRAASPATLRLLRLAAASGELSDHVLDELDVGDDAVDEALARDLAREQDGRLRFTHPLLAAAVRIETPEGVMRDLHGAVANVLHDPVERAAHLALATIEPDEQIAAALTKAAEAAARRAATAVAADLAEHALRLTPADSPQRAERVFLAVEFHLQRAEPTRARELLEALLRTDPPSGIRARAYLDLSWASVGEIRSEALAFAEAGIAEPDADAATRSELLIRRGVLLTAFERFDEAIASWETAARVAKDADDDWLHAHATLARERELFRQGRRFDRHAIDAAVEVADRDSRELRGMRALPARVGRARLRLRERDYDGARADLCHFIEMAEASGDEASAGRAHADLARIELARGDVDAATRAAAIAAETTADARGAVAATSDEALARVAATRGDVDGALRHLDHAIASEPTPELTTSIRALRGAIALTRDDPETAHAELADLEGSEVGWLHPAYQTWIPDDAEALVALGRADGAAARLAPFAVAAEAVGDPWALAAAARCRAVVLAAEGRVDKALDAADQALVHHRRFHDRLELGRTLLVRGTLLRRSRRKRHARHVLEEAKRHFDAVGAVLWSQRVDQELERTGREKGDRWQLTPTELRVAQRAAEGARNKEIAAALFMSEKTVEANLSSVYRKLDIRSRAQLRASLPDSHVVES